MPSSVCSSRAEDFTSQTVRMFGIPESEIAQSLREIEAETDLSALEITTCLRRGELEIEIRHHPGADASARSSSRGCSRATSGSSSAPTAARSTSRSPSCSQGHRIGLAESCTGGLLAARLTERPGSSDYVAGGVVSYSNEAKRDLLGVDEALIEAHGAVSPEVARAMAEGALERFDADVACAITGIAGPGGGTEEKPVGTVCWCVMSSDGTVLARDVVMPGDRTEIRDRSTTVAMQILRGGSLRVAKEPR